MNHQITHSPPGRLGGLSVRAVMLIGAPLGRLRGGGPVSVTVMFRDMDWRDDRPPERETKLPSRPFIGEWLIVDRESYEIEHIEHCLDDNFNDVLVLHCFHRARRAARQARETRESWKADREVEEHNRQSRERERLLEPWRRFMDD